MREHLGKVAKDKVTGFKGIVTGITTYLTGCDQYCLVPKAEDKSKYPTVQWLDVDRLEFQDDKKIKIDTSVHKCAWDTAPIYYLLQQH